MKPHKYIRKAKGYMGIWDDGPYKKWVKETRLASKRSDKQKASKDMRLELASQERIDNVPADLVNSFLDILIGTSDALITDLSRMSDFNLCLTKKEFAKERARVIKRVKKELGVDISDVYSRSLVDVLEFIQSEIDRTRDEE